MSFMRTRNLVTLAFAGALIVWHSDRALACSCQSPGEPCQNAFQADGVFAGTVRSISPVPDNLPPLRPGEERLATTLRVEFENIERFTIPLAATTSVLTPGSGPACGYHFEVGKRYLVYASYGQEDKKVLVTGICSRTRPIAEADEDVRFLRSIPLLNASRGRIYGAVTHGERNLATGDWTDAPVANVLVAASGPGMAIDAWTDAAGRYELRVPPGDYEVTAFPPPLYSNRYLHQTARLRTAAACFAVDFGLRFDGRIVGTVQNSASEVLDGLYVEAVPVERLGTRGVVESLRAAVDAEGHFEFIEVPPGRYVVGVDILRRMDPKLIFPTTFYPGTPDPAQARVIELGGGDRRELEPMTLPPARHSRVLTGAVVFADGTPAAGVLISLSDPDERRQVAGSRTARDGSFTFTVHDGLRYIATASYWDETQRTQLGGASPPFVPHDGIEPLRIVLGAR
jgi:hypothetical protein